jgi:uncharacterized membrane protein YeaQ/YmgE (transglycosylase-associated protein family)
MLITEARRRRLRVTLRIELSNYALGSRCLNCSVSFGSARNEKSDLSYRRKLEIWMGILWTLVIGFLAGVIAKFLHPGPNEPSGFIVTTLLGIAGAFVATYLGQAIGWYRPGEGAGLIGAVVGAIVVLVVWGMIARRDMPRT